MGWRRTFATLEIPEYRTLWWGMIASFVAMQMNIVARGYLAYDISGSAAALGLVSLAWGLPMLAFSLVGGAVADRMRKRDILIQSQVAMGVLALINAVLVHLGVIEIWHLVVLGLGQGTVFAFNMPARSAIIPEIVGHDRLQNAFALNNAGMNMSRIVGPAVAGGLISIPFFGMTGTFYLMAALYVVVLGSLLLLPKGKAPERVKAPMLEDIAAGFIHIRRNEVLLMLMSMAFVPVLFGMPYQTLMPVFQKDVLHVGSLGLGLLLGATGVGALVGSLFVASLEDGRMRGQIQLVMGLSFGVSLVIFAAMQSFVLALIAIGLVGLVSSAYMSLNQTMIMSYTEEDYYGRVMSVYMMTFSLMPLSAMPMGLLADSVGAPLTVAGAAALIVLFMAGLAFLVPGYRRIQ
ncbi:MAG TPA: MFS transporter [Dehalococcoidia bacterium]|nr:MFS transporter [Dehalococcoidia bacterium]